MKLPLGYYAVQSDWDNAPKDRFSYKGISYEVEEGVNLFPTLREAHRAAQLCPETVLEGLSYEAFAAPVILFSPGEHNVGRTHKDAVHIKKSCYLLGQNAGVKSNLFCENPMERPLCNPLRQGEGESCLRGGYDFGTLAISSPELRLFVMDGFTLMKNFRFADWVRDAVADTQLIFSNLIHRSPCGNDLYSVLPNKAGCEFTRKVKVESLRICDFSDSGYGGMIFNGSADEWLLNEICCDNTTQIFGFSGITRGSSNFSNASSTAYSISNSYIGHLHGENGICFGRPAPEEKRFSLLVENSTFADASREGEAPWNLTLRSSLHCAKFVNCRFVDSRNGQTAVLVDGEGEEISFDACSFEGFEASWRKAPPPLTEAPDVISLPEDGQTLTEDPHRLSPKDAWDFSALDAYYQGTSAYRADLHTHSDCGGTSDGGFPLKDWVARMDQLDMDFAAVVDHRQMRGYFLPEWDKDRFLYGTEPGTSVQGLENCALSVMHYNMLFSHPYGLAMLLANFPEFQFKGDELTGNFGYPTFTKERQLELNAYLRSTGGMLVHAHPKILMASDDPLHYYLGEFSYLETLMWSYASHGSNRSYQLWKDLLALGKHVYASSGSDTHSDPTNRCPATAYLQKREAALWHEKMYRGDFAPGAFGIQMMIDGSPMGSQIVYREGMTLTLRVGDPFCHIPTENTAYALRVITDQGLAYEGLFNGKQPQSLSLGVQKRRFYRVEIFDCTHGYAVGIGNPIWLDKEEQAETEQ